MSEIDLKFEAVLEITPRADGSPPVELIVEAYRASVNRPIAFVLTGVDVATVNACLDAEVSRCTRVCGVRYLNWTNGAVIQSAMAEARWVSGTSLAFLSLMRDAGRAVTIAHSRHEYAISVNDERTIAYASANALERRLIQQAG